jgi:hypothetical protein
MRIAIVTKNKMIMQAERFDANFENEFSILAYRLSPKGGTIQQVASR